VNVADGVPMMSSDRFFEICKCGRPPELEVDVAVENEQRFCKTVWWVRAI